MINFNMSKRNILSLIILLFAATLTFGSSASKDIPIAIECRAMAELPKDANIIEIAKSSQKEVIINGQLKALWMPVAENSKSRILDNRFIVARPSDSNQLQALVLVSPDDIVPKDVKDIYVIRTNDACLAIQVNLNKFADNKLCSLISNNDVKYLGEIIDGEIYDILHFQGTFSLAIKNRGGQKIPDLINSLENERLSWIEIFSSFGDVRHIFIKIIILTCGLFFLLRIFYLKGSKKRNLIITAAAVGFIIFMIDAQKGTEDSFLIYLVTIDYIKGFWGLIVGLIVGFILVNIFCKKLKNKRFGNTISGNSSDNKQS